MYRKYGAFITSLSVVVVLILAAKEPLAASGAPHGVASPPTHANSHRPVARPFQHLNHRHLRAFGAFWPGYGGNFYEPSNGEPILDVPAPVSGGISQPYDVPWDWAHRYPVAPGDGARGPGCPEETVTFRRRDGREQTVNLMRCY
jgi:hypothetical protein